MRQTVITVAAVCALAVLAGAQQSEPAFAVVSVKRNASGSGSLRVGGGPDTFEMTNGNLTTLVLNAYGLQPFRIIGAPDWALGERFDVIAKADTRPTLAQRQAMLKHLLAARFDMVAHLETRALPAYVLVRQSSDKLGPQLKPWTVDCAALRESGGGNAGQPSTETGAPACGMRGAPGFLAASGATMETLAQSLASTLDAHVVDDTKLLGNYEFVLRWARDDRSNDDAPSVFTAVQEQLGLKLESRRLPVEVLVIDHVERPSEN